MPLEDVSAREAVMAYLGFCGCRIIYSCHIGPSSSRHQSHKRDQPPLSLSSKSTEEKTTEEKATDEKATEEKTTEEKATEEKTTEEKSTEEKAHSSKATSP
jgi:hypothetical protein